MTPTEIVNATDLTAIQKIKSLIALAANAENNIDDWLDDTERQDERDAARDETEARSRCINYNEPMANDYHMDADGWMREIAHMRQGAEIALTQCSQDEKEFYRERLAEWEALERNCQEAIDNTISQEHP